MPPLSNSLYTSLPLIIYIFLFILLALSYVLSPFLLLSPPLSLSLSLYKLLSPSLSLLDPAHSVIDIWLSTFSEFNFDRVQLVHFLCTSCKSS